MTAVAPPADFGSAELRAGTTRVVVVPALGGKIITLELGGREWLWRSAGRNPKLPEDGASYAELGDIGGADECFPTVAPCLLPSNIARYGGLSLPDHGELWSQPSSFALETRPEGMYATCGWQGRRMPYRFVRGIFVGRAAQVEMQYAVTNDGRSPLPFLWSSRAVFPLARETRVVLPEGARVRVWSQRGVALGGPGAEMRWPRAVAGGKMLDLSVPEAVARAYGSTLYVDGAGGRAAIEQDGARLEVQLDGAAPPFFSIEVEKRAWTPFRRARDEHRVALAPSIGAPASLAEAIGGWRNAAWLEPGETREWTVTWRAAS
ncbi:MAG TPA: hypothetical protein VIC55_00745 [Gemmatimonadaceae bacterium]|jgi:hypothetical protein